MNVIYRTSFLKDLKQIKNEKILILIKNNIDFLLEVENISSIKNLKKLQGHSNAYRIQLSTYRIGFFIMKDSVELSRVLPRKDIYKKFP